MLYFSKICNLLFKSLTEKCLFQKTTLQVQTSFYGDKYIHVRHYIVRRGLKVWIKSNLITVYKVTNENQFQSCTYTYFWVLLKSCNIPCSAISRPKNHKLNYINFALCSQKYQRFLERVVLIVPEEQFQTIFKLSEQKLPSKKRYSNVCS